MSKLLRYFEPGQYAFLTTVAAERRSILTEQTRLLYKAYRRTRRVTEFRLVAWVVLPDHIHAIVYAPCGDFDRIVQRFKLSFSLQYIRVTGNRGPVWQHRYWDHIIRSEADLRAHLDYIHNNPVRHGLVTAPDDWPYSSFRRYDGTGLRASDGGTRDHDSVSGSYGE